MSDKLQRPDVEKLERAAEAYEYIDPSDVTALIAYTRNLEKTASRFAMVSEAIRSLDKPVADAVYQRTGELMIERGLVEIVKFDMKDIEP